MVLLLFGYIFSLGQTFSLKVGYLINNAFKNGSLANLVIQVGQSHKRRHLKGEGLVVTAFVSCNFLVRTLQCKKNQKKIFFAHEKLKKPPKKVAQNQPRPLFPTVQPRPQPTAQNRFSIS